MLRANRVAVSMLFETKLLQTSIPSPSCSNVYFLMPQPMIQMPSAPIIRTQLVRPYPHCQLYLALYLPSFVPPPLPQQTCQEHSSVNLSLAWRHCKNIVVASIDACPEWQLLISTAWCFGAPAVVHCRDP